MWTYSAQDRRSSADPAPRRAGTRRKNPQPWPRAYVYHRVVQAKIFIETHYAEALDVDRVSAVAASSKFHFIRLFREITGSTPRRYLTDVRIANAMERLAAGAPVTDACFDVGFASLGSFSRAFKQRVGVSPSAHRARCMARRNAQQERPLTFVPGCFARMRGFGPSTLETT
jgi:AraC-like DNA-binding protein